MKCINCGLSVVDCVCEVDSLFEDEEYSDYINLAPLDTGPRRLLLTEKQKALAEEFMETNRELMEDLAVLEKKETKE